MSIDSSLRSLNIDLPACPTVLVKLSLAMADEHAGSDHVAGIIENDMALSSAVVRTVNSAMFGLLKRVETVHEAIRYLGMSEVAGLTYEIGLRGAFPPGPLMQAVWDKASLRSLAMSRIAHQLDVDPWQAHTVGLFAESGRAVLIAYDHHRYEVVDHENIDENQLARAEIDAFGVSHSALGAALCQSWRLAREVADAVRSRTQPTSWIHELPQVQRLLVIGAAVDHLFLDPQQSPTPDDVVANLAPAADAGGLNPAAFHTAVTRVYERLNPLHHT